MRRLWLVLRDWRNLITVVVPAAGPQLRPVWTCTYIRLFAACSSLTQRALSVRNSAMEVPEPEFRHLAALARMSKAFVVELSSEWRCPQQACVVAL